MFKKENPTLNTYVEYGKFNDTDILRSPDPDKPNDFAFAFGLAEF